MASGKSILITGGFGFLGAHLASALLDSGFRVTLFDNRDWASSPAFAMQLADRPGLAHICGSVLNKDDLLSLGTDFNYIAHAAGILGIRRVTEVPILTMDVNILGTRNVLDLACEQTQLDRFLLFSSSEIYGQFAREPLENSNSEIPTQGARWCYAASKLAAEYLLKGFASEKDMPFVIVRPFNVYGPHRTGANAMTELIRRAGLAEPITIYGTGRQTRSWCHVSDFVSGVVSCLVTDTASGEAFNIGNDRTYITMLDLARLICELLESPSEITVDGRFDDDVETRLANIDKARRMLSYEPRIDLPQGIKDVAGWLLGQPNCVRVGD